MSHTTTTTKKNLPAKYNKILVFGYWLMKDLHDHGTISQTVLDEFTQRFHIFGSVESQIEVLDNFLESFKITHKNLKKEIRQQHKIKKVAVKPVEEKSAIIPNKRGRKKKIIEDTRSEEEKLMDEIISRAQLEK